MVKEEKRIKTIPENRQDKQKTSVKTLGNANIIITLNYQWPGKNVLDRHKNILNLTEKMVNWISSKLINSFCSSKANLSFSL